MDIRNFGWTSLLVAAGTFASCGSGAKGDAGGDEASPRTAKTERLLDNLKSSAAKGVMFGHQDDTVYGIGWEGDEGRSDVKSVCGDYPAVVSFDLGELELGGEANLDKVPFDKLRHEIVNQYQRGGMVSLSWHARNPKTGGDAWDVTDTTVVRSILPGGEHHPKFAGWLQTVASFINSLKTADGVKVPVLFRPWHEHSGSWFWWGEKLSSADEYKQLWRMTVDTLRAHGVDNALYAYSPGTEYNDTTAYLAKYPGDDVIDLVGFDTYQFDRTRFLDGLKKSLRITAAVAKAHGKAMAITEIGYEGVPDAEWWTGTLLPAIRTFPLSYVLVWRNARERVTHYYAPYPGQVSADDFVRFYNDPHTLFAGDVDLYK